MKRIASAFAVASCLGLVPVPAFADTPQQNCDTVVTADCAANWASYGYASQSECYYDQLIVQCGASPSDPADPRNPGAPQGPSYPNEGYPKDVYCTGRTDCP
jgi:hypothetical protein